MLIGRRRAHLGQRLNQRSRHVTGGTVRLVVPLLPRPSPDPELEVTWYPHRDAPSLLADDRGSEDGYSRVRGRVVYLTSHRWSWQG